MAKTISMVRTGGVLPDGVYKVRVEKMELKTGPKSDYLATQLRVDRHKTLIFENINLGENARFRLEAFMDAVGMPATGNLTIQKFIAHCRGKALYVLLTSESYQSRLKNIVKNFLLEETAEQMMASQPEMEVPDAHTEEEEEDDDDDSGDGFPDDDDDEEDGGETPVRDALPF